MAVRRLAVVLSLCTAAACRTSDVPLYTDLGMHHREVTTRSHDAQAYFDQGLRLYYAFNQAEAIRAFREATRLDPSCAMCWWGVALACGPNVNIPMDSAGEAEALAASQKASAALAGKTAMERSLVEALALRYAAPAAAERARRDSAWARAMTALAAREPRDADLQVLAAEAAMLLRPWNYWKPDGLAQPGTTELVLLLERTLARDSLHPGACHFYIHAVEAVQPERAVPCAERLASLMPGAGHLVHMPAHIYFRVGRYADAVAANEHASHADSVYIEGQHPAGLYPLFYTPHNHHFRAAAAMMEGRYATAIAAARQTARLTPIENVRLAPPAELYVPPPLFVMARFGKWEEILREPEPTAPELAYTRGIWLYVRGLAFAATGKPDSARAEVTRLAAVAASYPAAATIGLNSGKALLQLAGYSLRGEIAARAGITGEADIHYQAAIRIEDGLAYDEPPSWFNAVRPRRAEVLAAGGRLVEAERAWREDLHRYPDNGWSLYGLAALLETTGKREEALQIRERFNRVWARADTRLPLR